MNPPQKVRFPNRDQALFVSEVKASVAAYFDSTGRSRHADVRMVMKTAVLISGTVAAYVLILTGWFNPWRMLALAVLMGIGLAGIGFSVAHDALHGAYSSNPHVNRLLGLTFDLMGANGYMWKITHNVIHHTYTNIPGLDEDLTVSPLIRLSPAAPLKPIHRYQHLFAFVAYSFATLNWLFAKDFKCFMMRDIGPYKDKVHPRAEVAMLIGTKLFVYAYSIVIPLLVLEITWWQFLIGFIAMHLTAGLILGVIFQLAHVVEGTEFPAPEDDGTMEHVWLVHEMITTSDFAQENRWLSWYIGGLNFQIEHHLFPQVCSIHYPAIGRIVREVAQKHGVPYNNQPTLRAAIRSHVAMLKQLGRPAPAFA
ncbi:MAG TPA: acyl-CoA desaturase [Rhodothermales bacterium]|nr:acyl-CoA desaturase [Rhodothermales bacterium]